MLPVVLQRLRNNISPSTKLLSTLSNQVTGWKCGEHLCGYTIKEVEDISEIEARVIQLMHDETGAHHLHIAREDPNNTFSVGFPTIPMDSSGVSHILEHTTLCGSKKFPVRDPFFRMLTRTLSNFMNAFTANDWTMYLFSTQNFADYRNLLSVYLDCVFFPQLRYLDFSQEGWRLEHADIEDKFSPIIFKGVVFNEMKGYFANPENVYSQALQNFLYPSNTYSVVSGGKPADIVDLTYESLKRFHASHYHPSNAYFFTYGDISLETHLEIINDLVLKKFSQSSQWPKVPMEKEWKMPRTEHILCPPDPSLHSSKQTTFSISYKLPPITDSYESFVLKILSLLLVDGPASCFHKTLLAANIGSDFSPSTGYNDDTYEAYFSIGLQGLEKESVMEVSKLICSTFEEAIQKGFSRERVESILHKVEISVKDQKSNFGLTLSTNLMSHWIHGGNPSSLLKIDALLKRLKMDLQRDRNFLQSKLQKYFVHNCHQLNLAMSPSENYEDSLKIAEAKKLLTKLSSMSERDIKNIFDQGVSLRRDQNLSISNNPLPTVFLKDVEREVKIVDVSDVASVCPLQLCVQPTNGLTYLTMAINFSHLSEELKMYIPLFCYIATRVGAGDLNHVQFAEQCDLFSNGLSIIPCVIPKYTSQNGMYQELLCTSYCLDRNTDNMISLWTDLLTRLTINDTEHFWNLLKRLCTNLSTGISHSGHKYSMHLSSSTLTPACFYKEKLFGLTQIQFLKDTLENKAPSEVIDCLKIVAAEVFDPKFMRLLVHTGPRHVDHAKQSVLSFVECLPSSKETEISDASSEDSSFVASNGLKYQVKLPYPVNFVSQSLETVPGSHEDSPCLEVLGKLLSSKYLHKHIREIGGAYGSGAYQKNGVFLFMSYRDPNSLSTVEVFNKSKSWIRSGSFSDLDVEESKISLFSEIDSPLAPNQKGMLTFLQRISHTDQQKYRDSLFRITKKDLLDISHRYLNTNEHNSCILGQGIGTDQVQWTDINF